MSLFGSLVYLTSIVGGWLADRWGRRRVLAADLLVLAAGAAGLVFAPSYPVLLAGVIVAAVAAGADLPASLTLVGEQAGLRFRGRLLGITGVLWGAGIAGAIVCANVTDWLGLAPGPAARVLFGHVLVVALAVWAGRVALRESPEWMAAIGPGAGPAADAPNPPPAGPTAAPGARVASLRDLGRYWPALLATGLFYLLWNLQANTAGQFNAYFFTTVAGGDMSTYTTIGLVMLPLGLVASGLALLVIDTKWRTTAYTLAGVVATLALLVPALGGVTVATMLVLVILPPLLGGLSFESFYKIWTQDLFPPLVRGTAIGVTMFSCRAGTALFALVTPTLVEASPTGLFWLLFATTAGSFAIGRVWIARLLRPR